MINAIRGQLSQFFMLYQIGCIECREPSEILGVFDDVFEARAELVKAREAHDANWRGQRAFVIYSLPDGTEIAD